jgi:hypothetical protein
MSTQTNQFPWQQAAAARAAARAAADQAADEAAQGDNEMEHNEGAGGWEDYEPKMLKIGLPHPDPVVESNILASCEPPKVSYQLHLPEHIVERGLLSSLQLESIVYANQCFERKKLSNGARPGFFLGDGAGVGKGRQLAGLVAECVSVDAAKDDAKQG